MTNQETPDSGTEVTTISSEPMTPEQAAILETQLTQEGYPNSTTKETASTEQSTTVEVGRPIAKVDKRTPKSPARQMKMQSDFNKMINKMTVKFQKDRIHEQRKLKRALEVLEQQIGKEEVNALKALSLVITPEVKDDKGVVTQAEKREINYKLLFAEGRNVIALKREQRIKAGTRKKTTDRTSKRAYHRSTIKMLTAKMSTT